MIRSVLGQHPHPWVCAFLGAGVVDVVGGSNDRRSE